MDLISLCFLVLFCGFIGTLTTLWTIHLQYPALIYWLHPFRPQEPVILIPIIYIIVSLFWGGICFFPFSLDGVFLIATVLPVQTVVIFDNC